ncbi:MAG TPA: helix-turn-helix transcriptional regulator [Noviherbaspirillum sp.]|uniref:helix-turn-helix domain-containing protein n=1 Tax=Noviherbaspirillum sp. TaxID=1926288 RepID=UPI002B48186A|nr:helix-turn-helix transcriptional regulator [Noviherbaspirillum sp.]HJV87647.1 helix-turn-helix transcriptional regulator [Noviherbaspirillum sp.]
MRIFSRFPVARLSPYIDRFWGWESGEGETVPLPTVLPGTGAEVFFHYRTPFAQSEGGKLFSLPATHLLCIRRRPMQLAAMEGLGFIAVRFRAGALHHFTQLPGNELIDQQPRAQDLWGTPGKRLADEVTGARSHDERVALLQSFLLEQLEARAFDAIVSAAATVLYRHCDTLSIDQLAARFHLGKRQLERRFLQATGLTPVEVRRLGRFQKTARTLLLDPSATSADAALAHGYYDQSHFIREFQSLTALSPLAYLSQARLKTHFYNTPRPASATIHGTLSSSPRA